MFAGQEIFYGDQQVGTQTSFFLAHGIEVASLQQSRKKTLREILRILRPASLPSDERVNGAPVRQAESFQRFVGSGRLALCRQDNAPVSSRKGDGPIVQGAELPQRSHLIASRHCYIEVKRLTKSSPVSDYVPSSIVQSNIEASDGTTASGTPLPSYSPCKALGPWATSAPTIIQSPSASLKARMA